MPERDSTSQRQSTTGGVVACAGPAMDGWAPATVGASAFVVNRATRGMAATVRWIVSPDSAALLVVEDPAGVENEAIPDGALFATERTGRTWRVDSVWSVAPSLDWKHIAFGKAVVLRNGEADSIPVARWTDASRSLSAVAGPRPALHPDSLRASAFPVSAMSYALGVAATFDVDVSGDSARFPVMFAGLGGWTVGWSCTGHDRATLTVGPKPSRVQDDDPVTTSGQRWVSGPVLDISAPMRRDSLRLLRARDRDIEGRAGVIRVRDGGGAWRTVGPGIPLASTRGGRFILAVAPRTGVRPYESPDHAVVYRVP